MSDDASEDDAPSAPKSADPSASTVNPTEAPSSGDAPSSPTPAEAPSSPIGDAPSSPIGDAISDLDSRSLGASLGGTLHVRVALVIGFAAIAMTDIALTTMRMPPARVLSTRIFHHLFSTGYTLLLGLVVGVALSLARRAPRGALLASALALFVATAVFAFFGLEPDLVAFGLGPRFLFSACAGLALPLLWLVHVGLGRRLVVRAFYFVCGIGVSVGSHFVLLTSYPGSHVGMKMVAGTLCGLALTGLALRPRSPRRFQVIEGLACLLASASVVISPSSGVAVRLSMDESASLYGYLAAFYRDDDRGESRVSWAGADEWFFPRANAPSVPASAPLVPREDLMVLLVTIDAFRHTVFTEREEQQYIPNIMGLAHQSTVFENAHAVSSSTLASLPSIFSGRYLSQMQWSLEEHRGKLSYFLTRESGVRFPTLLGEKGVDTFFVPTTDQLRQKHGWIQGFARQVEQPEKFAGYVASKASMARLVRLLPSGPGERHFGFIHLMDAHAPYSAEGETRFEKYLNDIKLADEAIGRLVATLQQRRLWEKTILIVSSDHGEAFGEHNQWLHTGKIYEELVRVPLFVHIPGRAAKVVREPVTIIDIGPTVLDLFGVDTPGTYMGQSLVPIIASPKPDEPKFTRPIAFDSTSRQKGLLFRDGKKCIVSMKRATAELYDLTVDPGELDNLMDTDPTARDRVETVRTFFRTHEFRAPGYVPVQK